VKWISIEEKRPTNEYIIVAIVGGRQEFSSDPIEDAYILILRNEFKNGEWYTMDSTQRFFEVNDPELSNNYWDCIRYWVPWYNFPFPRDMVIGNCERTNV
jgi:hypothetical protein